MLQPGRAGSICREVQAEKASWSSSLGVSPASPHTTINEWSLYLDLVHS